MGRQLQCNIHNKEDLADAQYHKRCYNNFMKIPKHGDLSCSVLFENIMKTVIDDICSNQNRLIELRELHSMSASFGGQLSRKQIFGKLIDSLRDDIIMEGCASIIGFRKYVGQSIHLVVYSVDEEKYNIEEVVSVRHRM